MKAYIQKKYGGPEVLVLSDVPIPKPKKNEVLVKIYSTSVSSGDTIVRELKVNIILRMIMRLLFGITKPRKEIPGYTCSGVVEELGSDVNNFEVGDKVYAINGLKSGCYAEYVCVNANKSIVKKPDNISFNDAVSVPFGAMSALHILRTTTINKNDEVLIYGATGSVGSYGVQLAKYFGANVTAVCSKKNFEIIKSVGADYVIDYKTEDFTTSSKKYDVVFDAVGKITKKIGNKALKEKGSYISIKSLTSESKEKLEFLNEIIKLGKLKTIIDHVYSFDQMVDAHKRVDSGRKVGNVIVEVIKET